MQRTNAFEGRPPVLPCGTCCCCCCCISRLISWAVVSSAMVAAAVAVAVCCCCCARAEACACVVTAGGGGDCTSTCCCCTVGVTCITPAGLGDSDMGKVALPAVCDSDVCASSKPPTLVRLCNVHEIIFSCTLDNFPGGGGGCCHFPGNRRSVRHLVGLKALESSKMLYKFLFFCNRQDPEQNQENHFRERPNMSCVSGCDSSVAFLRDILPTHPPHKKSEHVIVSQK